MWIKADSKHRTFYIVDDQGNRVGEVAATGVLQGGEQVYPGAQLAEALKAHKVGNVVVDWEAEADEAMPPLPTPDPDGGPLTGLKVFLDAGHGLHSGAGLDVGAVGHGMREWDLNVGQALAIKKALFDLGAAVTCGIYAQGYTDKQLTLREKGARAEGFDIFVSLHHNAFNGSAQGHEVLIHTNGSDADAALAQTINTQLDKALPFANRGVKRQRLGVLAGVPGTVHAACLTESFFIDGPGATKERSLQAAQAIARGIIEYARAAKLV
jgi:N-acetylmuramoyl-L-alanine amidase